MRLLDRIRHSRNPERARADLLLMYEERNLAFLERAEWAEKVEVARAKGWPLPVGGGIVKERWAIANGLLDAQSAWRLGGVLVSDFSNANFAGAATQKSVLLYLPITQTANPIKSPDAYPAVLAAAVSNRLVGSGGSPIATVTGIWVAHITGAGAVYQPAGVTAQLTAFSTVTTVFGAADNLSAAFNVATGANMVDQIAVTAPAGRQPTIDSAALTTVAALYNGDLLTGQLVTGGALNVQANYLALVVEVV